MAPIEQHLRVLELERGTSHDAIKESYRRLVMVGIRTDSLTIQSFVHSLRIDVSKSIWLTNFSFRFRQNN